MVFLILLAAMSAATKDNIEVHNGKMRVILAILTLNIAGSGEHKSSLMRFIFSFFYEIQKKLTSETKLEDDFSASLSKALKQNLEKTLARKIAKILEEDKNIDLEKILKDDPEITAISESLGKQKANFQGNQQFIFSDTTIQALLRRLKDNSSGLLLEDEAIGFFQKNDTALSILCRLVDGQDYEFDRVDEKFIIKNPRLTACLCIQPVALDKYLSKKVNGIANDEKFVASGAGARCLTLIHNRVAGWREISVDREKPYLFERFEKMFERYFLDKKPRSITLSNEASYAFSEILNNNEAIVRTLRDVNVEGPFYSRYGENLLKLSGLFHLFGDNWVDLEIPRETILQANELMGYFYAHYKYVFTSQRKEAETGQKAANLLRWIGATGYKRFTLKDKCIGIESSKLLHLGPDGKYTVRKRAELNKVLDLMQEKGVVIVKESVTTGKETVYLTRFAITFLLENFPLDPMISNTYIFLITQTEYWADQFMLPEIWQQTSEVFKNQLEQLKNPVEN